LHFQIKHRPTLQFELILRLSHMTSTANVPVHIESITVLFVVIYQVLFNNLKVKGKGFL